MTSLFSAVFQRGRSCFIQKKSSTFKHRARLVIEQLEDRRVPASVVNLLVLPNTPLALNFNASSFTSPNPAISGSLNNAGNNYFLNQSPSAGNVKLNGTTMQLNNANSEAHIADFAAGNVVYTYTGSSAYIGGSTDAFILGDGGNTQTSLSVFPSQPPTAPSLDNQFVVPNTPGATVGNLSSSNTNTVFGFNDPVQFSITTPNSPFTIAQVNGSEELQLKPGQSLSGTTTVTVQASNTIYNSQTSTTTFTIGTFAITGQPQNQTIAVGGKGAFTVAATVSTGFTLTYFWYVSPHQQNNFTEVNPDPNTASYTTPAQNVAGLSDYQVDVEVLDANSNDVGDFLSNIATLTVQAGVPSANVTVSKTADAASVNAGDSAGFTLTIANTGSSQATGVTLTDTLPALGGSNLWSINGGANAGSFIVSGAAGSQQLALNGVSTLAAGATLTVHITGTTTPSGTPFTAALTNTATVDAGNETTHNQAASATITVLSPNVTVNKTPDAAMVAGGTQAGFTVTITNTGAGQANGLTLADALPALGGSNLWSVSAGANAGSFTISGAAGSQQLGLNGVNTLAAGASLTVHIIGTTTLSHSVATLSNTSTVDAGNEANHKQSSSANITVTVPLPKASINSVSLLEGKSGLTSFTFRVSLPQGGTRNGPVTYDVYTTDGTAKAGLNYVGITAGDAAHGGTVTIAQGATYATVTVFVIAGSLPVTQATERATFSVHLSDPTNPGVSLASGTGTIIAQTARPPAMMLQPGFVQYGAMLFNKKDENGW